MKKSLVSLLVGLSVGSSFAVTAAEEERWFEVEVILFDRNIDPAKVIEHWDKSLYPTYSEENKDPMALFLNDRNLITPNNQEANLQAVVSDTTVNTGLQPTLIDDSDTLPVFGDNSASPALANASVDNDIIKSTQVVIDGANLNSAAKDPALQIVPANELQLAEQFTALNDHANYNVVLHSAWRMQPKDRTQAVPIRLFAGQNYQQYYKQNGDAISPKPSDNVNILDLDKVNVIDLDNATVISDGVTIADTDINTVTSTDTDINTVTSTDTDTQSLTVTAASATPVWKVDGELTIYLEHYLYAKTDLFVRKEGNRVITAAQIAEKQLLETEAVTNAENIDLLKLLGIHLEPKKNEYSESIDNEIATNTASAAASTAIDTVIDTDNVIDTAIENAEPQDKIVPFLYSYPMQQLRVIRSGEIHYLDHPMFGMLIQIRKYQPPTPEEAQ